MEKRIRKWTMLWMLACMAPHPIAAQDYPQTDENGQTVYYKIMSAYPEYAARTLCLQDDSQNKTGFPYVLQEHDADQRGQEWTLVAASVVDKTFHLRNRRSYRYISTEGSWMDGLFTHTYATKKISTDALTIRSIGTDQVTISFQADDDERRFAAADVSQSLPETGNSLEDTPWAWRIVPVSSLTGIESPLSVSPKGEDEVYDLSGRKLSDDARRGSIMPHGVYIVNGKKIIR